MKTGSNGASTLRSSPCGTFSSSTMMVMMMASTPSLNASSLVVGIDHCPLCAAPEAAAAFSATVRQRRSSPPRPQAARRPRPAPRSALSRPGR